MTSSKKPFTTRCKFKVGDKVTGRNLQHGVFSHGVVDSINWQEEPRVVQIVWFYKHNNSAATGVVAYFEEELVFYDPFKEAIYSALQV